MKTEGGGTEVADKGVAWEELQVVRSERDQAVHQAKTLRQTVTALQHEKQVGGYLPLNQRTHRNAVAGTCITYLARVIPLIF